MSCDMGSVTATAHACLKEEEMKGAGRTNIGSEQAQPARCSARCCLKSCPRPQRQSFSGIHGLMSAPKLSLVLYLKIMDVFS